MVKYSGVRHKRCAGCLGGSSQLFLDRICTNTDSDACATLAIREPNGQTNGTMPEKGGGVPETRWGLQEQRPVSRGISIANWIPGERCDGSDLCGTCGVALFGIAGVEGGACFAEVQCLCYGGKSSATFTFVGTDRMWIVLRRGVILALPQCITTVSLHIVINNNIVGFRLTAEI